MIVYHASKKEFINDVFNGTIADDIDHAFLLHLGRNTSPNEKLSWKNSMMHMYKVVNTSDIPDTSTIAIEYQIPLTSKRIDFIISGADENQRSNIVMGIYSAGREAHNIDYIAHFHRFGVTL